MEGLLHPCQRRRAPENGDGDGDKDGDGDEYAYVDKYGKDDGDEEDGNDKKEWKDCCCLNIALFT